MNDLDFLEKRQIRIFVSSTFRDMQEERKYLITKVFPSIRRYCEEREVSLFELDLRWGISEEEAKQGKVFDICLREVRKTKPFFIGLLGERYGWIPSEAERKAMAENTAIFEDFPWIADELEKGTSITEIEMQEGVLRSEEKMNAFFYFRSSKMETIEEFIEKKDSHEANMLLALKKTIKEQDVYPVKEYDSLEHLGILVENDLKALVNELFPKASLSPLERERLEQRNFLKSRTRVYVLNPEWFAKLDEFVESNDEGLAIRGGNGMGKSALLANWITKRLERQNNNEKIIYHFIGTSQSSGNIHKIIQRLINEVRDIYNIPVKDEASFETIESENKNTSKKLKKELEELLFSHTENSKLIIVLDGIDHLFDTEDKISLLNDFLPIFPSNVKFIFSNELFNRFIEPDNSLLYYQELYIDSLLPENRKRLLKDYLKSFSKSLTSVQEERLGADKKCENPLVLLSVLDELRMFGIHEKIDEQIGYYLAAPDNAGLFALILHRIEELFKDNNTPNNYVKDILSLLAVSRHGLSETEILEISGATRLCWSQLLNGMTGQLAIFNGFVSFSNHMIRNAVEKLYLPDSESEKIYRSRIASYMEMQAQVLFNRKCDELPYQLHELKEWDKLYNFLLNFKVFKYIHEKDKYEIKKYMKELWRIENKCYTPENFFELDNTINKNDLLFVYKCVSKLFLNSMDCYKDFPGLKFAIKHMELCEEIYGKNHCDTADSYYYIGYFYFISEDKNKAFEYYDKALEIKKKILGENHPDTIDTYDSIGYFYLGESEVKNALEYFEKALEIRKIFLGENHHDTISSYYFIGHCYSNLGDKRKAIEYYKNAVEISERNLRQWEDYHRTSNINGAIGDCYFYLGDKEKALEYYENALVIANKTEFGTRHLYDVFNFNNEIGDYYSKNGDNIKALKYYKQALTTREEYNRINDRETLESYYSIGKCYSELGDKEKTYEYFKKLIVSGKTTEQIVNADPHICDRIGDYYSKNGDKIKAIEFYKSAIEQVKWKNAIIGGGYCFDATASCNKIGICYYSLRDYEKALEYLLMEEEEYIKELDKKHAESYYTIGKCYSELGDKEKAYEYFKKIITVEGKSAASYCNKIGDYYSENVDKIKALEFYKCALEKMEADIGKNHPDIATSYNKVGVCYCNLGNYRKALEYFKSALERKQHKIFYNNIGHCYSKLGYSGKAIEYHKSALEIMEADLGKNHPDIANSYNEIGNCYYNLGDYGKALEYYENALGIYNSLGQEINANNVKQNIEILKKPSGLQVLDQDEINQLLSAINAGDDESVHEKSSNGQETEADNVKQNVEAQKKPKTEILSKLEYHKCVLDRIEADLGKNHYATANSYNEIGKCYYNLGDYGKALEYYENALGIYNSLGLETSADIVIRNIENLKSPKSQKTEVLTQDEINQLLTAINT